MQISIVVALDIGDDVWDAYRLLQATMRPFISNDLLPQWSLEQSETEDFDMVPLAGAYKLDGWWLGTGTTRSLTLREPHPAILIPFWQDRPPSRSGPHADKVVDATADAAEAETGADGNGAAEPIGLGLTLDGCFGLDTSRGLAKDSMSQVADLARLGDLDRSCLTGWSREPPYVVLGGTWFDLEELSPGRIDAVMSVFDTLDDDTWIALVGAHA